MKKYALPIAVIAIVIIGFLIFFPRNKVIAPTTSTSQTTQTTPSVSKIPTSTQVANPASENCVKQGGTVVIKDGPNGQYGLCDFGDNMACEEWALLRGDCPVGGIKTTGFDAIEQKYCAWLGGKTVAQENASCALPSGKVCSDTALYNGTCASN